MKRNVVKRVDGRGSVRRKTAGGGDNTRIARLKRTQALAALQEAKNEMAVIRAAGPEIVGKGPVPSAVKAAAGRVHQLFSDRTALSHMVWLSTHTLATMRMDTGGSESHQRRIIRSFLQSILRDDDVVMTPNALTLTGRDAVPTSTMQVSIHKAAFPDDVWDDIQSLYTCPAAWKSQMFLTNGAPRTHCLFRTEMQGGLDRVALLEAFVRVVFVRQRSTRARVAVASILATELPTASHTAVVDRTNTPLASMCNHLATLMKSVVQAVSRDHVVGPVMVFNPCPDPTVGQAIVASVVRAPWCLDLRHAADANLVSMLEEARLSEAAATAVAETRPTDILLAMTLDTWNLSSVRDGEAMPRPPPIIAVTTVRAVDGSVQTYVDTVRTRRLALARAIRCAADGDTMDRLVKTHKGRPHVFQLALSAPETVIIGAALWPSPGTCPTKQMRGGGLRNILFPQLLVDSWTVYTNALDRDDKRAVGRVDDSQLALTVFFLLKARVTRSCPVLASMVSFTALACTVLDVIEQGTMADPETLCPVLTAHVKRHTRGGHQRVCVATPAAVQRLARIVVAVAWVAVRLAKLPRAMDAPGLFTHPTEAAIAHVFVHSRAILRRWQVTRWGAVDDATGHETVSRLQTALRRLWVGTSAVVSVANGADCIRLNRTPGTSEPMLVHDIIAQARATDGPRFSVAVSRNVVLTPTFTTAFLNWVSEGDGSRRLAAAKWFLGMVRQPPGVPRPDRVRALPRVLASLGGFDTLWTRHGAVLLDAAAEFVSPSVPPSGNGSDEDAFIDGARRTAAWFTPSSTFREVTRVPPVSLGGRSRSGSVATDPGIADGRWTLPSGPGMASTKTVPSAAAPGVQDLLSLLRVAEFARGFVPEIRHTPPSTLDIATLAQESWPVDPDVAAAGMYSPTVFASNITIPPHTGHVSVPFLSYTTTASPETLVTVIPSSSTLLSDDDEWLHPPCIGTRHPVPIPPGPGTVFITPPLFSGVNDLDVTLNRWHGASGSAVVSRFFDSV